MTRKMPAQKPHRSEQAVGTPRHFLDAVEGAFGPLAIDLAAVCGNAVCVSYLGPDHPREDRRDSLLVPWSLALGGCVAPGSFAWLNPEFENIGKWASKCVHETRVWLNVLMLVPASVGSVWYREIVQPHADVYSVGRMKFVGHDHLYPKDLILCHFWRLGGNKFKHWQWKLPAVRKSRKAA